MRSAALRIRQMALAAVPLLLTGCAAVGPNYVRPPVANAPQYRFVEGADEGESLADAPWFKVFDDPTLQALIREGVANNLDLRGAVARLEEARAQAGVARSFLYPQVDGTATYSAQ